MDDTKQSALVVRDDTQLSRPGFAIDQRNPLSIIQYAIDHGANVETIERLMGIRKELQAEQAKAEFDNAMAAFQSECPVIVKTRYGYNKAYKYASLDDIIDQVRGLLKSHGFSYTITSDIVPAEKSVKAVVSIRHSAGHSESSEFKVPIDDNMKNLMSMPQRFGAAMTFAKRYAFCNGFGIMTADEDTDGNANRSRPEGPGKHVPQPAPSHDASDDANKRKLVALTRAIHFCNGKLDDLGKQKLTQWLIDENLIADDETLEALSGERLASVVSKIERAK